MISLNKTGLLIKQDYFGIKSMISFNEIGLF